MPNLFNVDFLEFLELLSKHKVDYILVGGYANPTWVWKKYG